MKKIILAVAFLFSFGLAAALAQEPPKKDPEGFEPVNGDMMQPGESIPASRLVAGAYGFIFAAVVVWVVSVTIRSRKVEEELDQLKHKLESKN